MNATTIKRFGQFELLERIGSGGMADVFKAQIRNADQSSKFLALKRMHARLSRDAEWVEMFTSEARITAQLNHPNIVQVLHFGRLKGVHYLAMEYIDGHDLGWLIERSNARGLPLPLPIVVYVVRELCRALYHAHRHRDPKGKLVGLVHRDVSPQNVLVSRYGDIKLVDFGIAKAIHHSADTTHGKLKGNYGYMAPEQLQNDPVDRRTDIFALGAVFFEALTGRSLFQRTSILDTTQAILEDPIVAPSSIRSEIPSRLDGIVLKALARLPRDRFDSARILRNEIEDCARESCGIAAARDVAVWLEDLESDHPPESLNPTLPPPSAAEVAPGTLPFRDDEDETGITARKLPIAAPNFDDCDTAPRRADDQDQEWTVDEGGEFFEPSGNKDLDPDPNALLERLSSSENRDVLHAFGADDVHEEPTAVALIDVEGLLAKRRAQVQKGRSAEIPAPALAEDEALYAFGGDEESTQASPIRTAALLEDLEVFPSAEVVISDLSREQASKTREEPAPPARDDPIRQDLVSSPISAATRKDLIAPNAGRLDAENLEQPAEGEGFDEDAATVLNFNPPAGMFAHPNADAEVPTFPESTSVSFSQGSAAQRTESRRQPTAPTDALSVDLRLPLVREDVPPRKGRAWLWVTLTLLALAGAGAVATILLSMK